MLSQATYEADRVDPAFETSYVAAMDTVPIHELRSRALAVIHRVERGESLVVTVDGRPVARLGPLASRPSSIPWTILSAELDKISADLVLLDDLAQTIPDTTDDPAV